MLPASVADDPYAAVRRTSAVRFLYGLNPLAKMAAVLPALVLLVFVRDLATPVAFLALSYLVLLVGVSFKITLKAPDASPHAFYASDQRWQMSISMFFAFGLLLLMLPLHTGFREYYK